MVTMRKALLLFIAMLLPLLTWANAVPGDTGSRPLYAANIIKVQLSPDAISATNLPQGLYAEADEFGLGVLDELGASYGNFKVIRAHIRLKDAEFERKHGVDRWFLVKFDQPIDVPSAVKAFKGASRYIDEAVPEYYAYTQFTPNDPYFPNNWGHNNTAQLPVYQGGSHSGPGVGTIGFDARIQQAWDHTQGMGSASIIIAIIDTGVDTAHPDLRLVAGYDYGDNDSNPMDNSADPGHGTACSGVAAGIGNNSIGVAGSAPGCSVMPLKIADSGGSLQFTYIENAILHCGNNNVDVASMSFGAMVSYGSQPSIDTAINYAYNNGVAMFAATANGNTSSISYPANHPYVVSVGAASPTGQRKSTTSSDGENWWGSNYGTNTQDANDAVDIMGPTILPATDITGTGGYATGDYSLWFNGTSCATPYVAGVAGLLLSKDPSLTPSQLRAVMVNNATDMTVDGGAGWDRFTGYGLVNANAALNALIPGMPSCVITSPMNGSVQNLNSIIPINVNASDSDGTITQVRFYINDTLMFTDYAAPYTWSWNSAGYAAGSHSIKADATDNSSNVVQHTISVTLLAPPDEGFESGNFSAFPWTNTSPSPWTVQTGTVYSGTYAARSGVISDNGSTTLSITRNVTSAGNISFFQMISSEASYDYLRFYIDGVQQGQWSGSGAWTQQTYPVSPGMRTFAWTYSKDGSVSTGSDCAFIDHIVFPPTGTYWAPPQNLIASPGNAYVNLTWQAPASGTPTGYKVFRNSTLLTTVNQLNYTDSAVINETTYTYHVTAVYSGGESEPSNSVQARPSANPVVEVVLGNGTGITGTSEGAPINIWYKSLHGQAVYTAAELTAAGISGSASILGLGFYNASAPTLALPNFRIRMKHTSATNVSSWQTLDGMVTVYTNAAYMPTTGGFEVLTLSTPFVWDGVNNIVVDTAFDMVANYSQTGTVQFTSVTSGYRYVRSDTVNQGDVFTGESVTSYRPNLKLSVATSQAGPVISVTPLSFDYGSVQVGQSSVRQFVVSNSGNEALTGSITTPAGYTVALSGRNTLGINIPAGQNRTYNLTFQPTAVGTFNGNVVISTNAINLSNVNISVTGSSFTPPNIAIDNDFLGAALMQGETGTDAFTISNLGSQPLNFTLEVEELRFHGANPPLASSRDRSIAGSTLNLDASAYLPGSTVNWVFSATNASTDNEWLENIYITFPAGVTVNSATNFVGGTGGEMLPDLTSGDGITIHWFGEDSNGWGVIYPNETGVATVNVSISAGMSGPLNLTYTIVGDIYGAEPHTLEGSITIPQGVPPIAWFNVTPIDGSLNAGQNQTITGNFSAIGMPSGIYEAMITINSNDAANPQVYVNVMMEVTLGSLDTPVITGITASATGITITWQDVPGAYGYRIYRATEPNGSFVYLTTVADTSYEDPVIGDRFFYHVIADNN